MLQLTFIFFFLFPESQHSPSELINSPVKCKEKNFQNLTKQWECAQAFPLSHKIFSSNPFQESTLQEPTRTSMCQHISHVNCESTFEGKKHEETKMEPPYFFPAGNPAKKFQSSPLTVHSCVVASQMMYFVPADLGQPPNNNTDQQKII